jgi:hypothetical protein
MSISSTPLPISTSNETANKEKLIQYTKNDFETILNEGFVYKLKDHVIAIIQQLSEQVGAPEYIKTPQFEKRYVKTEKINYTFTPPPHYKNNGGNNHNQQQRKKYTNYEEVTDEHWENIRNFKATVLAKKEGIDAAIDQVRKHLNKMTKKTYDTLKTKIIDEIKSIINETEQDTPEIIEELNKIGEALFTIASGNSFYSEMYSTLYKELMETFDTGTSSNFMKIIFKNNFEKFRSVFDKFDYCDPIKDYDGFCNNNKTNEKRRALSLFYINLMKLDIIDPEEIIVIIKELQKYILDSINVDGSKNITDELSEILFILITNSSHKLSTYNKETWLSIVSLVKQFSGFKTTQYVSITNKSIFKHLDILDVL